MNIKEIIAHLVAKISNHTDLFTDYLDASIITATVLADKRTVEVETDTEHELLLADAVVVVVNGSNFNAIASIDIADGVATVKTVSEHDYNYDILDAQYLVIENADATWNGTHEISDVTNRNTVEITAPAATAPATLGNIRELRSLGVNGVVTISEIVSTTKFKYEISDDSPTVPAGTITGMKIVRGCRIAGAADPERATKIFSESTGGKKEWMFVMLPDESVSKSSHTKGDAVAIFTGADEGRINALINFDIAVILPSESLGAVDEVQKANGEIKTALISCLFGLRGVETDTADMEYRAVYTGSATFHYNTATYIRLYSFQIPSDITFRNTDSNIPLSVALRDLVLGIAISENEDADTLNVDINLDEEE